MIALDEGFFNPNQEFYNNYYYYYITVITIDFRLKEANKDFKYSSISYFEKCVSLIVRIMSSNSFC